MDGRNRRRWFIVRGERMRSFFVRAGLAALGLLYVAMGVVSARVAFLGASEKGQGVPGALALLMAQKYGPWLLGAVVAGLAGIALASVVGALRGGGRRGERLLQAVNAVGYGILTWSATRALLSLDRGTNLQRAGASWLLTHPWGPPLIALVGLVVGAAGLLEMWLGFRGKLPFRRDLLPRRLVTLLSGISRFGLFSRGLVVAALGYFVIQAARALDPKQVHSFGGTLRTFAHGPLGTAFVGVIALGLVCYGVYLWTLMLLKRRV
jgi:hypothetical protein